MINKNKTKLGVLKEIFRGLIKEFVKEDKGDYIDYHFCHVDKNVYLYVPVATVCKETQVLFIYTDAFKFACSKKFFRPYSFFIAFSQNGINFYSIEQLFFEEHSLNVSDIIYLPTAHKEEKFPLFELGERIMVEERIYDLG